ncbi:MAG: type III-A CRISPR-associated protein Csm2 [bacterium]|jgi:CRISPR type III-A-associated protein Csm2
MSLADYVRNSPTPDSAEKMIQEAEAIANSLASRKFTMTQLRGIFGHVRRLDAMGQVKRDWTKFRLLEPRIHYRLERHIEQNKDSRDAVISFKKEILSALKEVGTDDGKFNRFVEAFETIVAYMPRK